MNDILNRGLANSKPLRDFGKRQVCPLAAQSNRFHLPGCQLDARVSLCPVNATPTEASAAFLFPDGFPAFLAWHGVDALPVVVFAKALASFRRSAHTANCGFLVERHVRWVGWMTRSKNAKRQVFNSVVVPNSVSMVNQLGSQERPTKMLGHHQSVLKNVAVCLGHWVSFPIDQAIAKFVQSDTATFGMLWHDDTGNAFSQKGQAR
jgi:hypothetical protein